MSVTIEGLEIYEAEFGDETETSVVLLTVNNGSVARDSNWSGWSDLLAAHPHDIFIKPMRPNDYVSWDYSNNVWVLDQSLFTPFLRQELKSHRDSKATLEVTYNGVTAKNTVEERNLIVGIIVFMQAKGEEQSLAWKQPDDEFVMATISDFQGIMLIGGQLTQNAFAAEAYIIAQHAMTPYTDIPSAIAAFDTYFNNL